VCLSSVGQGRKDYQVIQNTDAFKFFDPLVDRKEAIYETAGVLGNGELAFITAKMPDVIRVGTDIVEPYVLLVMSHDGTRALQAQYTPVRVVCNNTLNAAMRKRSEVRSIRHTSNADARLKEAAATMGMMHKLTAELAADFAQMQKRTFSDGAAVQLFQKAMLSAEQKARLFDGSEISTRSRNIIDAVTTYYHEGPGQDMPGVIGTGWGVYNAVTGYFANAKNYRDESQRFRSNLLGGNHTVMQRTANLILSTVCRVAACPHATYAGIQRVPWPRWLLVEDSRIRRTRI